MILRLRSNILGAIFGPSLLVAGFAAGHPRADALSIGLKVWRKPGAIQGGAACATCHSPDGIELAVYDFDDADILRRARPHLGEADSRALVTFVHALRGKLHITRLRDPEIDRPLQPGSVILHGATPAARDLAFGLELKPLLPNLFEGRIETIAQARVAEAELLRLQPVNLKVGIPFNRLSEDIAHGNRHASIAQWLPEEPPLIAKADLSAWYAAEDTYLAHPSASELHRLLLLHTSLVNSSRMAGFGELSVAKFRALLVLQDRMRRHTEAAPVDLTSDVAAYGNYNPIWEVGETARQLMGRSPEALGMAPAEQAKKLSGPSMSQQLHALRVAWFWAGWLSDQGLFKTSHDDKTRLGMWLSQSLSEDGPYPIHDVYANARRQAVVSNEAASWGETAARRRRIWDFAGLRSFQYETRDLPTDPRQRRLYIAFTANCFRMNLLLLESDIERTHVVWVKRNTLANIRELVAFIDSQDPADESRTDALRERLDVLVAKATERT